MHTHRHDELCHTNKTIWQCRVMHNIAVCGSDMKRVEPSARPVVEPSAKRHCVLGVIIGVDVIICGLQTHPGYNGKVGVTVAHTSANGVDRWVVEMADRPHSRLAVQPHNLQRVESATVARFVGLKHDRELNGREVRLHSYNNVTAKWLVRYETHTECRTLTVRQECLQLVRPPAPRQATQLILDRPFRSTPNTSARSFFVTINNPTRHCYECIQKIVALRVVAARERGPRNGVLHVHAIVVFTRTHRRNAVNVMLGGRAWVEVLKGRFEQVAKYVLKNAHSDDDVLRYQDHNQQGRRTDLHTFVQAVKNGMSDEELVAEFPVQVAKYNRCIPFIRGTIDVPKLRQGSKRLIGLLWIWSTRPDVGKTTYVHTRWPDLYSKTSDKWWPFYFGQAVVFIDDPHPDFKTDFMAKLKMWCNECPFYGEFKGAHTKIRFKHLIVCANQSPEAYFGGGVWKVDQHTFNARFTTIEVKQRTDF